MKRFPYVLAVLLFATWGTFTLAAMRPAYAQQIPGQCINLSGNWASNSDFSIGLQQIGCNLHSTYTQARGYNHSIQGQCAGNQCTWTVFRHDLSNGCQTALYGVATMLDYNHFQTIVTGSDGQCELPQNYSETRIYRRT
jgi:hypothetical protein